MACCCRHYSNSPINFSETRHSCITFKFFGECVALEECAFTSRLSDFVQESDVREFRDRVSACSSYGKRLICCEKSTNSGGGATTSRPSQINYQPTVTVPRSTVTTRRTTYRVYTTHQLTTSKIPTFQGDPLSHPNYRFFQSLKCGSLFVNRVAHGMWKVMLKLMISYVLCIKATTATSSSSPGRPSWGMRRLAISSTIVVARSFRV